ncbi:hypothetical protein DRO55_00650 [Candidatus Bathyarchaeota archaeon]|nr:MAG: hypothetical protein DRO55_00650 [Candidatus Bathyarchaeota archaeon]
MTGERYKESEVEVLRKVCEEAKRNGKITGSQLTHLTAIFGQRFLKAWDAVINRRVKRYRFKPSGRVVWVVVGREREYLVMPIAEFCSCDDFYYRVMDGEVHLCYHLIAQKVAESLGWYDKIEEEDGFYETLIEEWREVTP